MGSSENITADTLVQPEIVISVKDCSVKFGTNSKSQQEKFIYALNHVSLEIFRGETLALVGESGGGKTTLGRVISGLRPPTDGSVFFEGQDLYKGDRRDWRRFRRTLQVVFQDPFSSLNPKLRIGSILREPLQIHKLAKKGEQQSRKVQELLKSVGMHPDAINRFPVEFSGGQRQRIGIARALAVNPKVIVLDEPISALDVSIQAQILNLLIQLRKDLDLTYLFIAHDLAAVRFVASRVAVMYMGSIVEIGETNEVYDTPRHPYTMALLSAAPIANPEIERKRQRILLHGDLPSATELTQGCSFASRCWLSEKLGHPEICTSERPRLIPTFSGHSSACHFPESIPTTSSSITAQK